LTIKSTSHTNGDSPFPPNPKSPPGQAEHRVTFVDATFFALTYLCFFVCPSNIQLSKIDLS
jgi:hypothetical protein